VVTSGDSDLPADSGVNDEPLTATWTRGGGLPLRRASPGGRGGAMVVWPGPRCGTIVVRRSPAQSCDVWRRGGVSSFCGCGRWRVAMAVCGLGSPGGGDGGCRVLLRAGAV
jgi:hypothetical protein